MAEFHKKRKKICHMCAGKTVNYKDVAIISKYINLDNFNFIKLGPYIEDLGPLNSKTTNQRFYKIEEGKLVDITNLFWRDND